MYNLGHNQDPECFEETQGPHLALLQQNMPFKQTQRSLVTLHVLNDRQIHPTPLDPWASPLLLWTLPAVQNHGRLNLVPVCFIMHVKALTALLTSDSTNHIMQHE